ncbi:phosphoesterase family-domain-containing protein [Absidia repens]|uniref:Phosphoesterase family-domain-containing protein n=1 Tax=Absidia repens TaxID=90262 RepID=A0A1X2HR55_9FUNG|nr:phosphoesterase family-domain-containing protein [Absidia repens]
MKFLSLLSLSFMAISSLAMPVKEKSHFVSGKFFDRVVIVIFENIDYADAHKNPYFSSLADKHNGVELTNFTALTHPSQPNYIGLISGSTEGCIDDELVNLDRDTIVDLLEKKHVSWKSYQQGFPGDCALDMTHGKYARKHNPFISFKNIQTNPDRCAKIVNADELTEDIKNDTVPQFVFFTPDMDNDGHDTNLTAAANWFESFIEPLMKEKTLTKNTMFVSTFDEAEHYTNVPNGIQTVLFGPDFKRKSDAKSDDKPYNLYSILRTVEDNWDLGTLNLVDRIATPLDL